MPAKKFIALFAFFLLPAVWTGCASNGGNAAFLDADPARVRIGAGTVEEIEALSDRLSDLGGAVDPVESRRVARTAVIYSRTLAARYRLVRPAVWHNILVRVGLRERGLCHHWTTDLMHELQSLGLTSLELRWGVAHKGSELREHNTVVVTARGQPFDTGMVLDPWRNSGRLFWAAVAQDRYPWRELPRNLWF